MSKIFKKHVSGFTLVELLIVVAIIGVLATIGVPTFKKMLAKAKKSEAKVALGGLATVEAAFFSEYGGYGNRIDKVGFELEGTGVNRIYTIGFTNNTCGNPGAIVPGSSSTIGAAINQAYPAYYDTAVAPVYNVVATSNPSSCVVADVWASGASYTAQASGVVSPGKIDQWTMDQTRSLANTVDGI